MVYLALIYHMHQPYYKNLISLQTDSPWVRLHAVKDYVDMVLILRKYPKIHAIFNLVPSLLEQIEDLLTNNIKEKPLELSCKAAKDLTEEEKEFIIKNFFAINKARVISSFPRFYELYYKREAKKNFSIQDILDLQVLFNLAWIDPLFRESPEIKKIIGKGRFYNEDDKKLVLNKQFEIIKTLVHTYKEFSDSGQIEIITSPFYHPILPLLYNTKSAKEANPRAILPKTNFSYPQDAKSQIKDALSYFSQIFGHRPEGMWPSEQSVSQQTAELFIDENVNWIVTDEAILFKSIRRKKRDTNLLYQPHLIEKNKKGLNIIFRDRNLSDLIGFEYHKWKPKDAVKDFLGHLEKIDKFFKDKDVLVTVALDGENAWEYYSNDGHDFLNLFYAELSESEFVKTVTVSEYLKNNPAHNKIKHLSSGSWIFGDFGKWIGNPYKIKAWEYLAKARGDLKEAEEKPGSLTEDELKLAKKQINILEGSDWFWWYGEDPDGCFDRLFRMHLSNFYSLIKKDAPDYVNAPLVS